MKAMLPDYTHCSPESDSPKCLHERNSRLPSGVGPHRTVSRLLPAYLLLVLWNSLLPFQLDSASSAGETQARALGLPVTSASSSDVMSSLLLYALRGVLISLRLSSCAQVGRSPVQSVHGEAVPVS